jgi:hypothetical protein
MDILTVRQHERVRHSFDRKLKVVVLCASAFCLLNACDGNDSTEQFNTEDTGTAMSDRGILADMYTADIEVVAATDMMVVELCPDDTMPPCVEPPAAIEIAFNAPQDGIEVTRGTVIPFEALITSSDIDLNFVAVTAEVDEQPVPITFDPATGLVTGAASAQASGQHVISINARLHPDVFVTANRIFLVDCDLQLLFNEPLDPNLWRLLGDAERSQEGWLDTTNGTPDSRGVIILAGAPMRPDQLDVSFKVQATPAWDWMRSVPIEEAMSDGFAVTFWNIGPQDIDGLEQIISGSGNGMGYGVYPSQLGETGFSRPESFTVEFDTYYNYCQQGTPGRWYEDPTNEAHVAITYNGYWHFPHHYQDENGDSIEIPAGFTEVDENGAPFSIGCGLIESQVVDIANDPDHPWAPIPQLRDNAWHDVRVTIQNGSVTVYFDEVLVLDSTAVLSQYKGGLLAFSGGSGAASAYYKFDDLTISGGCQ